jgi:hypothetical protein
MISGVISTMAILIITILQKLKEQQAAFGSAGGTGMPSIISGNLNVSPFMFILIVGVYLVESLILLCYLMSGIDSGEDPVGRQELTGYVLLIGIIAFTVVVIFTSLVFQPLAFTAII